MNPETAAWVRADKRNLWHPFTPMRDWCDPAHEPAVLVSGEGAVLRDSEGREYFDGNSSIWTNLHGHRHPRIDRAVAEQLARFAHTSFLGATHPGAIRLAEELAALFPPGGPSRVFYSDDGSTAIEAAIKMAAQFWRQTGDPGRTRFIAFEGAYHGDTMGASSLGGIPAFHGQFAKWQFPVLRIENPEQLPSGEDVAAVVIEPLVQGAAGIRLWPRGTLAALRAWCDRTGALLILDEVLTGFGRTGTMFACEREGVVPDLIALAKGLTAGYLPLAATLATERIFEAFLGAPEEMKTFYYGHSYCGSALGCAAAIENLAIFREENVLARVADLASAMGEALEPLREIPHVRDIRRCGAIAGIELGRPGGAPLDWRELTGARVCAEARRHGLLTRPIRDVVTLIPPYCATGDQVAAAAEAIRRAIAAVCG